MKKFCKFIISLTLAIQINGFFLGIFYSAQACREGIMPFKEVLNRDRSDKIALLTTILVYPGFYVGSNTVNVFRKCGRIIVNSIDR